MILVVFDVNPAGFDERARDEIDIFGV